MVRRFNFFPKLDVGPVKWAGPKATPSVAPRRELSSVRDTCKHLWKGWRTSQATGSIFSKTFLITLFKVMSGNGTILWDARCTVTCQISKSNVVKFPVPLETYDPASPVGFLGVSSMWVRWWDWLLEWQVDVSTLDLWPFPVQDEFHGIPLANCHLASLTVQSRWGRHQPYNPGCYLWNRSFLRSPSNPWSKATWSGIYGWSSCPSFSYFRTYLNWIIFCPGSICISMYLHFYLSISLSLYIYMIPRIYLYLFIYIYKYVYMIPRIYLYLDIYIWYMVQRTIFGLWFFHRERDVS